MNRDIEQTRSHRVSDTEKHAYRKKMWIALLAPLGVFIAVVFVLALLGFVFGMLGIDLSTIPVFAFLSNTIIPLIFSLCLLAVPAGIAISVYFGLKSRG